LLLELFADRVVTSCNFLRDIAKRIHCDERLLLQVANLTRAAASSDEHLRREARRTQIGQDQMLRQHLLACQRTHQLQEQEQQMLLLQQMPPRLKHKTMRRCNQGST
jgi:hypothetical protein